MRENNAISLPSLACLPGGNNLNCLSSSCSEVSGAGWRGAGVWAGPEGLDTDAGRGAGDWIKGGEDWRTVRQASVDSSSGSPM